MHQAFTTYCRYHLLIVLLPIGLGACQRSSYSFQRPAASYQPLVAAPETPASSLVALAQPSQLINQEAPSRRRSHRARHPQAVERVTRLRPTPRLQALAALALASPQRPQEPLPPGLPEHRRSRGIAALLAFFLIPFGVYNFYLGYYSRGVASLLLAGAGFFLFLVGALMSLFNPISPVLIAGLVLVLGLELWQLVDVVRILTGDLKPNNGEYYPRFFQTRP